MNKIINFFNKNKFTKIISILYFGFLLYNTTSTYLNNYDLYNFGKIIFSPLDKIGNHIVSYLTEFFMQMVFYFPITIVYFATIISHIIHNRKRLEKIDYVNENIFRDIIKEYSPGELGYIDHFKLTENHILATVLDLELKGRITINNELKVIDKSEEELSGTERYVLKNIKSKTYYNISVFDFKKNAIKDCEKNGLIEIKKAKKPTIKILFILFLLFYFAVTPNSSIFNSTLWQDIPNNDFATNAKNIIYYILTSPATIFFLLAYTVASIKMSETNPEIRTEKGKEINAKLEGLKKYVKDFSILPEREQKELKIWNEYLIYSVMFGMNKNVVEEIKRKLNV